MDSAIIIEGMLNKVSHEEICAARSVQTLTKLKPIIIDDNIKAGIKDLLKEITSDQAWFHKIGLKSIKLLKKLFRL